MKLGQSAGLERAQLLLVDQMIADQSMLRAVAKLNVKREGLEQFVPFERRVKVAACAIALIQLVEPFDHGFEVRSRPAEIVEWANSLLAVGRNPGMAEVDVDLGRTFAVRRFANQKWLDRQGQRAVARIPAVPLEKQILAILEPEQRQRREVAALEVPPEQNRELVLDPAKLARHGQARHDRVAELGRRARANPNLAMILAVEDRVIAQGWITFSRSPVATR